ncbi:MAG: hypothetical protein ACYDH9_15615 [Limisphaerales bacterium]
MSQSHISLEEGADWTVSVWEGGGKRGRIGAFTPASRLRFMRKMARVRCDVVPEFVTVTYTASERWVVNPLGMGLDSG